MWTIDYGQEDNMPEAGSTRHIPQEAAGHFFSPAKPGHIQAGRFTFPLGKRTYIMGILNVTPDSFADGGKFLLVDQALRHAEMMLADGADILDIGGESSRPGGMPVSLDEELSRIMPVVEKIGQTFECCLSIDTAKAAVAKAALAAGASMVNDINGLLVDPEIAVAAFQYQSAVVVMHNARLYRNSADSASLSPDAAAEMKIKLEHPDSDYPDSLANNILAYLERGCQIAAQAGLPAEQIIVDPGIGFGVSPEESIQMIARLDQLGRLNLPVLVGPSRKRFIGHILNLPVDERLHGTSAAVAISIAKGADIVRVHDVREMVQVARVADAICRS
jgi:dihydropteroate synthase